jgi:hypothetical protein
MGGCGSWNKAVVTGTILPKDGALTATKKIARSLSGK